MLLDRSSEVPRLLTDLDAIIERSREAVEAATRQARALIETGEEFGWCFLTLESLPEGIASAGLFVLPAGSKPTPHRHPNSVQHMRRLTGEADVRLTDRDRILERRVSAAEPWLVIAADVTHRIEVGGKELVVLSFHTVTQQELLEVTDAGQRRYS